MAIQNITGMKIMSSEYATEEDGYEEKEVMVKRGGFWERIFEKDPTLHIWDDYKPVKTKVPKRKPIMYRVGDILISHPSLVQDLMKSMDGLINTLTHATNAINGLSDVYYMDKNR